jgi:hypothetical protein
MAREPNRTICVFSVKPLPSAFNLSRLLVPPGRDTGRDPTQTLLPILRQAQVPKRFNVKCNPHWPSVTLP